LGVLGGASDARSEGPRARPGKLRDEREFRRLRVEGQAWSARRVVIRVLPNGHAEVRLGIVASKRLGKAVKRNRARRLIREAMRCLGPRLAPGWDVVVIARAPILDASMPEIETDLEHLLRRAGLIARPPEPTVRSAGGREVSG
jgi:ribonuclease P protein component